MKTIGVVTSKTCIKFDNYRAAVQAVGANVKELDPYAGVPDYRDLIRDLDGLIIPGGLDLQPFYYGEKNIACGELDPELDGFEMGLVKAAVDAGIPILGICRGMQLINVFFGGTLYQDISCAENHRRCMNDDNVHCSRIEEGSFLDDIYYSEMICVNSAHHQGVKRLGDGLVPVQYSSDGIVEAYYHREKPIWGVQWHPERMCLANERTDTVDGLGIFKYFISKCSDRESQAAS